MFRMMVKRHRAAVLVVAACSMLLGTVAALAADVPIATVPVGKSPTAVAVDPVAHRVYVANFYGDTVSVLDSVADTTVATVPMPKGYAIGAVPNAIVVDPLATPPKVYVANWQSHIITYLDGTTLSAITNVTVPSIGGGNPRALAINPSSTPPKLYVADYGRSVVSVLNATTGAVIREIPVGLQPRALGIFVSAPRTRVYVANRGSNSVSVIDGDTDSIVATLPTGAGPKAIAVDPNSGWAYVSSPTSNTVTAIDASDTVAADIPVGRYPMGLGVETGANRLFVANRDGGDVSVIDTLSRTVVATIPAGVQPVAVAVDRGDRKVFVGNYGGSSVTIIDRNLAVTTCAVGAGPIAIASDEALTPHKAYCANWTANTVTVIDEPAVAPAAAVGVASARVAAAAIAPADASPVVATVDALPGDATTSPTPALTGSATCQRQPFASNVVAVLVSIDGGALQRAEIVSGAGTPQVTWRFVPAGTLAPGPHTVAVQVYDQASAASANSGQDQVAAISGPAGAASYSFAVTVPVPHVDAMAPDAGVAGTTVTFSGSGFGDLQGSGWVSFGGAPGVVASWSDTQVVAQVPAGVSAGYAGIVRDGGTVSNGMWFTPATRPVLDGISATFGAPGTQVTFTGSGFGAAQGAGTVTFAGTPGVIVSWSDTAVVAQVPAGAVAGYAGVVQNGLASNGVWFVPSAPPVVTGLSGWWSIPGSTVTISGSGFGAVQGSGWVTFGGVAAEVVSWSDTSVVARVPTTPWSGYVGIVQNGLTSNGFWFLVAVPPTVSTVTPTAVVAGQTITITGSGFGATQDASWVTLGGTSVPVVSWSDTQIVATVAPGSASGYAGVVRGGITSNGVWVDVNAPAPAMSVAAVLPGASAAVASGSGLRVSASTAAAKRAAAKRSAKRRARRLSRRVRVTRRR